MPSTKVLKITYRRKKITLKTPKNYFKFSKIMN